jgi:hypothetical protein
VVVEIIYVAEDSDTTNSRCKDRIYPVSTKKAVKTGSILSQLKTKLKKSHKQTELTMQKTKRIIFVSTCLSLIILICLISCTETTKPEKLFSVEVNPSSISLARGSTQQFNATTNGTDTALRGVSWTVTGAQAGSTINTNGLLTVTSHETANTLTVRATSTSDNSIHGTATVSLTGAIVTGVTVNPSTANVSRGATQDFTAVVTGHHSPPQTVNWSLSGNNSTSTTINSSGSLSVADNENATTLTITARSTFDNTRFDTATVTVTAPMVTFNVSDVAEWSQAVNTIRNGGNNRVYTINVNGEIALPVSTGSTFGSATFIEVTFQGNGSLTPSATGNLIRIGVGQNIIARGSLTLNGISGNNVSIISIESGGVFRLEGDVMIQNNPARGIVVNGGIFEMSGGTIRGNSISGGINSSNTNGGGVRVVNGFFTMSGGLILENTASGFNGNTGGSGVAIASGAFTMTGGTISGNTTSAVHYAGGGGVRIDGGSFTMEGGTISGNSINVNTALSGGGGVYFGRGSFSMTGGLIQNNISNQGGGGVYLRQDSYVTFYMSGGTITGNVGSRGGGVHADRSTTFTKSGGSVSGNTATGSGNTAFSSGSPNRWRNANAGPTINTADYGFWLND